MTDRQYYFQRVAKVAFGNSDGRFFSRQLVMEVSQAQAAGETALCTALCTYWQLFAQAALCIIHHITIAIHVMLQLRGMVVQQFRCILKGSPSLTTGHSGNSLTTGPFIGVFPVGRVKCPPSPPPFAEPGQIVSIRAGAESIEVEPESLSALGKIGARTSLRCVYESLHDRTNVPVGCPHVINCNPMGYPGVLEAAHRVRAIDGARGNGAASELATILHRKTFLCHL